MNTVGKIFVGLICLMSIVFMTMAMMVYATHTNWRNEITRTGGYQEQLKQARTENAALNSQIRALQAALSSERSQYGEALAKLQTDLTQLNQLYTTASTELAEKSQLQEKNVALLKQQGINLADATKKVDTLHAGLKSAQERGDGWYKRGLVWIDELTAASIQLAELKPRLEQVNEMYAKARLLLSTLGFTTEDFSIVDAPPPLDSEVAALTKDNLVEVRVGSDDGIRKGHELDVYRGNNFLGRIRIIEVRPDEAVGQILKEYQTAHIRVGDKVTSKLKSLAYIRKDPTER